MNASKFRETPEIEGLGYWDEHLDYTLEDWQSEVANDDTRLGYWDWVLCQMEQAGDDDEIV